VKSRNLDLFTENTTRPGALGCRAEIAGVMADAMKRAAERGISREEIAARMSTYLGEKISVGTLNGYVAPSHTTQAAENGQPARDISFMRAMAFDAAIEEDALIGLFAEKRGARKVVTADDAALLEWAHLHRQEKELAERKKQIEAILKVRGNGGQNR
jgi:hypothetical protein